MYLIINQLNMEIIIDTIRTTLNSFDFSYCIIVNILTYIIIKVIDDKRKDNLTTWQKRIVLLIAILSTGVLYYLTGSDSKVLLNSAILSPVFWSWIMKPICKYFNIDYKKVGIME